MALRVEIEKDLGDFSLRVAFQAEGGVHGLLGASGSGKSMTLRCIAGVERPDRGQISLDGRVLFDSAGKIDLPPQQRRIGLLFQHYALFPNLTLEGNLRAALPRGEDPAAIGEMLRRFRLEGLEKLRPGQLSGGQQQRAALARILLTRPAALLLDEPFSALDSDLRWQTEIELMQLLEDFPGPALLVTHSRGELRRLCRTVTVLSAGRGAGEAPVEKLFTAPETLAECQLAGYENHSAALVLPDGRLSVPAWGAVLRCLAPLPPETRYAAVRARQLRLVPAPGENVVPCRVARVVRDVSAAAVLLAAPGGGRLRAEPAPEDWAPWAERETVFVYFPPEALLPLK